MPVDNVGGVVTLSALSTHAEGMVSKAGKNDPDDNSSGVKVPSCSRHKDGPMWRRYDALPPTIKLVFQDAMTDWCVSCFLRDSPVWMIPLAVELADEAVKSEMPYGALVQTRRPQGRRRR